MRTIIADLHNHTNQSDGVFTPTQLIEHAKSIGLKCIGVTDHDTIAGIDEALSAGKDADIQVICGTEVSIRCMSELFIGSIHLLLYFSKALALNPTFTNELESILQQGRGDSLVRNRIIAINREFGPDSTIKKLDRPLTEEDIKSYGTNITRRHFALALEHKHGITDRSQIDLIIGNNSPAYIPSGIDLELLLPIIKEYKILRVLAHPACGSFPGSNHYKVVYPSIEVMEKLLPDLLHKDKCNINGIEVYYPAHTDENRFQLLQWAYKYDLCVTGGSDCHDIEYRPLGIEGVTSEELSIILSIIG